MIKKTSFLEDKKMASSKNSGREKIFEAKLTKYETWLFENHCSI